MFSNPGGGHLRPIIEEAMPDFFKNRIPISSTRLPEKAHRRVPGAVGAMHAPAPIRGKGKNSPRWNPKGAC